MLTDNEILKLFSYTWSFLGN